VVTSIDINFLVAKIMCATGKLIMPHGPFSRRESPTQTIEDAKKQTKSGEIWGSPGRYNCSPCVRAYKGPLETDMRGIEFETEIAVHPGSSTPIEVYWYFPHTPGVEQRLYNSDVFACIAAVVQNRQP
jgi:hypothetical protein